MPHSTELKESYMFDVLLKQFQNYRQRTTQTIKQNNCTLLNNLHMLQYSYTQ